MDSCKVGILGTGTMGNRIIRRRQKMKKSWFGLTALLLAAMVFGGAWEKASAAETKPLPKMISITTYGVGTAGYVFSSGLAEAITKISGIQVRIEPTGTDASRTMPVRSRNAEFSIATHATATFALLPGDVFETPEWGPQPFRLVSMGPVMGIGMWTKGNSGIKTMAQLKGKRVASIKGSPGVTLGTEGCMAFGGLTWNDVKNIPFGSLSASMKGVVEGTVDSAFSGCTATTPMELTATPAGIYWIPTPAEDKEGWARLVKVAPYMLPGRFTEGAGITEANPWFGCGYPYSIFAYDFQDENLVYTVTKSIAEGYDVMQGIHPHLKKWTLAVSTDVSFLEKIIIPYHAGSIKYFKEVGKWTARHQAWQDKVLKDEQGRIAAFKAKHPGWAPVK